MTIRERLQMLMLRVVFGARFEAIKGDPCSTDEHTVEVEITFPHRSRAVADGLRSELERKYGSTAHMRFRDGTDRTTIEGPKGIVHVVVNPPREGAARSKGRAA